MTAEHISAVIVKTQESRTSWSAIDTAAVPARCAVGNDVAEGGIAIDVTDEFGDIVVFWIGIGVLAWTKGSVTGKGKETEIIAHKTDEAGIGPIAGPGKDWHTPSLLLHHLAPCRG